MAMRADRVFVALLLVISIAYAFEATRIFNPPAIADPLGPRAFPQFLGIVGVVLSIAILLGRPAEDGLAITPAVLREMASILAALAAYALLLPRLGFVLATTGLLTAGFAYAGGRRPVIPAVIYAVLVHLLFTRLLGMRLPTGILPWL